MDTPWKSHADDFQDYLARGVIPLPPAYAEFLEALSEREREHKLCLLPFSRFDLYHIRLERKVRERIRYQRRAA